MIECVDTRREQTISENIGLVHSRAHRFKGRGIEYDDLFQAGCMGLCKAVDAFDPQRGVKLSTYAVPVILGEMRRLFRDGGAVKVSRTLKELSLRIGRARERLVLALGREAGVSASWRRRWSCRRSRLSRRFAPLRRRCLSQESDGTAADRSICRLLIRRRDQLAM